MWGGSKCQPFGFLPSWSSRYPPPLSGNELVSSVNFKSTVRSYTRERNHKRLADLGRGQAPRGHPEFIGEACQWPFFSFTEKKKKSPPCLERSQGDLTYNCGILLTLPLLAQTGPDPMAAPSPHSCPAVRARKGVFALIFSSVLLRCSG